jgi:hypothetical protein
MKYSIREKYQKRSSFSQMTGTGDLAIQCSRDDIEHNIHSEAASTRRSFRCEKRIENMPDGFIVHSLSIVPVLDMNHVTRFFDHNRYFSVVQGLKAMDQ